MNTGLLWLLASVMGGVISGTILSLVYIRFIRKEIMGLSNEAKRVGRNKAPRYVEITNSNWSRKGM